MPSDISIRANSNSLLPSEGKGHRFDSYRVRHLLKPDVSTTYLVDDGFSKAPQNGRSHAGHNRGVFNGDPTLS